MSKIMTDDELRAKGVSGDLIAERNRLNALIGAGKDYVRVIDEHVRVQRAVISSPHGYYSIFYLTHSGGFLDVSHVGYPVRDHSQPPSHELVADPEAWRQSFTDPLAPIINALGRVEIIRPEETQESRLRELEEKVKTLETRIGELQNLVAVATKDHMIKDDHLRMLFTPKRYCGHCGLLRVAGDCPCGIDNPRQIMCGDPAGTKQDDLCEPIIAQKAAP